MPHHKDRDGALLPEFTKHVDTMLLTWQFISSQSSITQITSLQLCNILEVIFHYFHDIFTTVQEHKLSFWKQKWMRQDLRTALESEDLTTQWQSNQFISRTDIAWLLTDYWYIITGRASFFLYGSPNQYFVLSVEYSQFHAMAPAASHIKYSSWFNIPGHFHLQKATLQNICSTPHSSSIWGREPAD